MKERGRTDEMREREVSTKLTKKKLWKAIRWRKEGEQMKWEREREREREVPSFGLLQNFNAQLVLQEWVRPSGGVSPHSDLHFISHFIGVLTSGRQAE